MPVFGRVGTAMVTPFHDDGSLDLEGAGTVANHLLAHGTDTIVLAGTTGESPTLEEGERIELLAAVRDAVGNRAALMVGTGTNATARSVAATEAATEAGADAILAVAPYYNKPDHAGMMAHFTAIASATDLPVLLYDVPHRTAVEIPLETLVELSFVDNVVGVKDAAGRLGKTADVLRLTAGHPGGFEVYCGADELNLPMLALGAAGLVSVSAHLVGDDLARMCTAVTTGDLDTAREIHLRLMPMHTALFASPSPAPLKAGMELLGLPGGPVRGPLVDAPEPVVAQVRNALHHAGILPYEPDSTDDH
ncbi:4-hydroxy-tetrahydrodipicolinate synthase [Salsipaludibacter albus]|uniref:4-hydroxy-tetrahydrodipicolinate synthase n=1 Tax=Salsipaludibacter albus TaxID=2849650 RepID=UPI001EE43351|nr:4-hydroxy-tetrahydrodipicolinate synthase [Salsipaludibacter albus]MBY5163492.1 4-hydroxy-tetrahydrodipicolinate synthase [Salsipaludibacter albus]